MRTSWMNFFAILQPSETWCNRTGRQWLYSNQLRYQTSSKKMTPSSHTLLTPECLRDFRKPSSASGRNRCFSYHLGGMWDVEVCCQLWGCDSVAHTVYWPEWIYTGAIFSREQNLVGQERVWLEAHRMTCHSFIKKDEESGCWLRVLRGGAQPLISVASELMQYWRLTGFFCTPAWAPVIKLMIQHTY